MLKPAELEPRAWLRIASSLRYMPTSGKACLTWISASLAHPVKGRHRSSPGPQMGTWPGSPIIRNKGSEAPAPIEQPATQPPPSWKREWPDCGTVECVFTLCQARDWRLQTRLRTPPNLRLCVRPVTHSHIHLWHGVLRRIQLGGFTGLVHSSPAAANARRRLPARPPYIRAVILREPPALARA